MEEGERLRGTSTFFIERVSVIYLKDAELMRIQAETLYIFDEEKRITGINETDPAGAPLLFIGRTKHSAEAYFHHKLPLQIVNGINRVLAEPVNIVELCKVIEGYRRVTNIWIGPAYFCQTDGSRSMDHDLVVITEQNRDVLARHFEDLIPLMEARSPVIALLVNGSAVSVCCSARKSEAAAEASLATAEPYRGNGYAQRVVREWARQVSRIGLIPLYSTSWDNLSSQRIAQQLGMIPYGMDFSIYG